MIDRNFGIIGFRDGAGRARFKATGAPDADSFPTAAEAKDAARRMRQHAASSPSSTARSGAAASAKPTAASGVTRYTAAEVAAARASGIAAERARAQAVFDCPASRGRERGCAALLTSVQGWSAATIVAQLASLPTDQQIASGAALPPPAGSSSGQSTSDAVWDRARAASKPQSTPGEDTGAPVSHAGTRSPDAAWDRAGSLARTGAAR